MHRVQNSGKRLRTLTLLLGLVSAAGFTPAAPVLYDISFTGGTGLPPTSGTFLYDAAVPVFSNFFVLWNGFTFDLTASANSATITGPCDTAGPAAADAFAFLTTPACNDGWSVVQFSSPVVNFYFVSNSGPSFPIDASATTTIGQVFAAGDFSVSESVPEPTTLWLVLSGGVFFTWQRRRQKIR